MSLSSSTYPEQVHPGGRWLGRIKKQESLTENPTVAAREPTRSFSLRDKQTNTYVMFPSDASGIKTTSARNDVQSPRRANQRNVYR